MLKYKLLFVLLVFGGLVACQSDKKDPSLPYPIFHVDLDGNDEARADSFCNSMQLHFVPLETTDQSICAPNRLIVKGDDIFIVDLKWDGLFRFDRSGKFINSFLHRGQGAREYQGAWKASVATGKVYFLDMAARIQVYDYNDNYLKTILLDSIPDRLQLYAGEDGRLYVGRGFQYSTQLLVYDTIGNRLGSYFPGPEEVRDFGIPEGNFYSLGNYGKGVYFTGFFDPTIYLLEGDSTSVLAKFDFGKHSLTDAFFAGTSEDISKRYWDPKVRDVYNGPTIIFQMDNVVIGKDWITFYAHNSGRTMIYCNRKSGESLTNRSFKEPYKTLLGDFNGFDGYLPETDEYYFNVSAYALKETIEKLAAENPDYAETYPFLKDIDTELITEDTNDFVVFAKFK